MAAETTSYSSSETQSHFAKRLYKNWRRRGYVEVGASYDEQITRLDRDGCCRQAPAYFKARQRTKRVAVADVAT